MLTGLRAMIEHYEAILPERAPAAPLYNYKSTAQLPSAPSAVSS
jgi:hypothetical protein